MDIRPEERRKETRQAMQATMSKAILSSHAPADETEPILGAAARPGVKHTTLHYRMRKLVIQQERVSGVNLQPTLKFQS